MKRTNKKFIDDTSIGANGCKIITAAAEDAQSGTYYAAQFVTDCTLTSCVIEGGEGTFAGITFKAGTVLYGDITNIRPGVGESLILYKAQ